ncbi:MAG: zf-HC2 domain-containing protein [Planctomycetota bacterium]|nr:zf-HC2 domain-containing protein [Planctomycetota bacterium]
MITCRSLIDLLDDYAAGRLEGDGLAEAERHLAVCPPCRQYVKQYQETIRLAKAAYYGGHGSEPPRPPAALVDEILRHLRSGPGQP